MKNLSLRAEDSFEDVLSAYSDMVYRLAFSRVKNSHDANDITQDVFLKYIRAGKTYNDEEHRKAWLIKTTVNASKTLVLSSWHRRRSSVEFTDEALAGADVSASASASDNTQEDFETKSIVLSAVMNLPKKYRTVIHLFYYEDLPLSAICEVTGQTLGTVKSQLSRARGILKEKLGDFDNIKEQGDDFNDVS